MLQGAAVVSADGVIVFTSRDAVCASELGARQVHVVPCGSTLPHRQASDENSVGQPGVGGPHRVGFAGNLYYEPNLCALRYLATQLAPHLGERAVIDVFVATHRPRAPSAPARMTRWGWRRWTPVAA